MPITEDVKVGDKSVSKGLLKLVSKLVAIGFDVSTKESASLVTSCMATGVDKLVAMYSDQEWAEIFKLGSQGASPGHIQQDELNLSSPYEHSPKIVGRDVLDALAKLRAQGNDISTQSSALEVLQFSDLGHQVYNDVAHLSEQDYQKLLKMVPSNRGASSMRRVIIASSVSDSATSLIETLFDLGFKVWDYSMAQKALSLLSNNPAAAELGGLTQDMWPALMQETVMPSKPQAPAAPVPSSPPSVKMEDIKPPAPTVAPPVQKSMEQITQPVPAAPAPPAPAQAMPFEMPSLPSAKMPPNVEVKPANKQELISDLASQYEALSSKLPLGAKKVEYGEPLSIPIKDMKGKPGGGIARGGQFIFNQSSTTEGMVIGSDGQRTLYVVKFPSGMADSWNVDKMDIRAPANAGRSGLDLKGIPKRSYVSMTKLIAQMSSGQAQDPQGNPIIPGDMIQDPNNSSMQNGGQVLDIKQDGSIVYQNDQGQKVMKNPGAPVEVIKKEGPDGQIQQSAPPTSGAGGPNMIS